MPSVSRTGWPTPPTRASRYRFASERAGCDFLIAFQPQKRSSSDYRQSVSSLDWPGRGSNMRAWLPGIAWVACLWLSPAAAADRTLSVTIYNDNLALVQERRDIEVKDGRQRLEFQDVSAQI